MSIKIPSKSIYDIKNNIIIKNKIDKIDIKLSVYSEKENVNVAILEDKLTNLIDFQYNTDMQKENINAITYLPSGSTVNWWLASYVAYLNIRVDKIFEKIYKSQVGKYIYAISEQVDENILNQYEFRIFGNIEKGKVKGTWNVTFSSDGNTYVGSRVGELEYTETSYDNTDLEINIPDVLTNSISDGDNTCTASTARPSVITNRLAITDYDKYFNIDTNIYNTGIELIKMSGKGITTGTKTITLSGSYEKFIPTRIEIIIYGDTITLDAVEKVQTVGDGENVLAVESNQMIQYPSVTITGEDAIETNFSKIIEKYKNGKETATLRCSINDYYDLDGNKVIDIKNSDKMCFEVGDEVIPYVYTAYGTDKPMSVDKQGNAKVFRVLGVRTFFDGAVWQELTLQEKS